MAAPNILCDCTGMTNEMWLKCREHGPKGNIEYTVGGSDVATIFGLSPWTTPLELWMVKKGRMKPKSPPNPDQLAMGHMLEPIAAHFYAQRTGNTVTDDNYLYQHATLEYALANIDRRYTRREDGEGGVLECKSLTYHKAADWADGAIPIYYELQLRYYLAVLDEKHGAFSALWGNNPENDLATPHIERVQAKEDIIFEKLDRWIWSLRHDKPPTMEDVQPQLAMDALARIYGAGKKGLPTIEFPRKYEPQLRKIAALQEENAQLKGAIKKNEEASLNAALHDEVNPAVPGKAEIEVGQRVLRVGDKVMQMRNRDFASNGDIGYICTSTQGEDGLLVEVDFGDDRVVAYEDIEALRQLELAYATTIHKSQGSEYDAVLINIQDMHGKMLNRALFYTAETRAKKRVIIVGDWDAVVRAIQTADTKRRHTMLAMRINELTKE